MRAARTSCSAAGSLKTRPRCIELADEYGISAERVRQIESAALKRLKTLMAA